MTRAAATLAALAVLLAGCSSPAEPAATPSPSASKPPTVAASAGPAEAGLDAIYRQHISWQRCGSTQCGTLTVPLDYAHPAGTTLKLAVLRVPSTDRARRIGSLVVNPGGPGASGVDYARNARLIVDKAVRARYDIVGFDPRGVGGSVPIHCLTDKQTDAFLDADQTPDTPAEIAAWDRLARGYATACAARAPGTYASIGTVPTARDLDVLRAALGDDKLHWLGASYGTFIGATYADLFPAHVGRMVLDGAVDPTLGNIEFTRGQAKGFEVALRRFVEDCARQSDCPLPSGTDAGVARIQQLFADLDRAPLRTDAGRPLTEGLARNAVLSFLYSPASAWDELRFALQLAFGGDGTDLLDISDGWVDRSADGHYTSNLQDAYNAIIALDHSDRPGPEQVATLAAQWAKESPTWGAWLAWSNLPYHYWTAPATDEPHAIAAPGAPPILVVGTTYDPATPYPWAQSLASQLSRGVLLTRVGDGHTGYGMGSSCTDAAVDRYLLAGMPPAAGTICH